LPQYNVTEIIFREVHGPNGQNSMAADVSLLVVNPYPVNLETPPLVFDILVPNCVSSAPHILLADATTAAVVVREYSDIRVNVRGIIRRLPDDFTKTCPNSHSSPLDLFLGDFLHGQDTMIFVRGSNSPAPGLPGWIGEFISSITVPIALPHNSLDGSVKNFSISDIHFSLPDPLAIPGTPEASPTVSGNIQVQAGLPKEIGFDISVSRIRAKADVFYKGKKLGILAVEEWQAANSTQTTENGTLVIEIESRINNAPLNITDENIFSEVMQELLFSDKPVILSIKSLVDVEVGSVLGDIVVRDVPGEGVVPVKRLSSF
jgi:hypothetical protein